jgi:hypothetical protein
MLIAVCWPPRDEQHAAAGHDGGTATRNAPATITASGKASEVTKCGRRDSLQPPQGLRELPAGTPSCPPFPAAMAALPTAARPGQGKVVVPFFDRGDDPAGRSRW